MANDPGSTALSGLRRRALTFGVFAIGIAGFTAYIVFAYVSQLESELQVVVQEREKRAVVAAVDLTPGTVLTEDLLRFGPRPLNAPPDQIFSEASPLVGQTVSEVILAGEAIRPQRLTAFAGELRIDEVIDPVSRAVTLKLPAQAALGGLLRPGHYVDVLVTVPREMKDGSFGFVTETVLQGVRVLAVDATVASTRIGVDGADGLVEGNDGEQVVVGAARFVTLEVEPREAKGLVHAGDRGKVHLALRPSGALELSDYGPSIMTTSLVGLPEGLDDAEERLARKREISSLGARAKKTMEVITIRGGQRTISTVDAMEDE